MKTKLLYTIIVLFVFFYSVPSWSQVGIGTTSPNPSAILDISSSSQGLLIPRMTSTQRLNDVTPIEGLIVYDTDEQAIYFYDQSNSRWQFVSNSGGTDSDAGGDINMAADVGAGFVTEFTGLGISSRKKVAGTSTSNNLFRFTAPESNRLTYTGLLTQYVNVYASISFESSTNNTTFAFYLARISSSGVVTVIESTKVYRKVATGSDIGTIPIVGAILLSTGESIEVWTERHAGSGDLETVSLNLIAGL